MEAAAPVATKGGGRLHLSWPKGMGISLFHTSIDIEFIYIIEKLARVSELDQVTIYK